MSLFIGRKKELQELRELLSKKSASLLVIKGRRRIGKSRLAEEFGKSFKRSYYFSGLAPSPGISAKHQKEEFIRKMNEFSIPRLVGENWGDLFRDTAKNCSKGSCLVVLDEISWMGMKDPTFLPQLKTAWDQFFSKNPSLVLLLSGSQSTWIEQNILNSSGFVGRVSYTLHLEELSLSECNEFWQPHQNKISAYEKFKILSVTGGVPRYLEEIHASQSAEENIKKLCFRKSGLLFNEFEQIFSDLFSKRSEKYRSICKALSEHASSMDEVIRFLGRHKKGRSKGGDISEALEDLCKTGFISRDFSWDIKTTLVSKLSRYRLSDNYLRFYLKWIEPQKHKIASGISNLPIHFTSILGLQFENLVLSPKNRFAIYEALKLSPEEIVWSNPFFQTQTQNRKACQIDWMIQSKHNTLYVCEVKFSKNELQKEIIKEVQQKIARLIIPKNFSVRAVLIHVGGVSESVTQADYFSHIIDYAALFGL